MKIAFRIDDLGFDNEKFETLTNLFIKYQIKFSCAAIPSQMNDEIKNSHHELCEIWQHGYWHKSFTTDADEIQKKSEYPQSRDLNELRDDLIKGRKLLEEKFDNFCLGFIPPWNRMSDQALSILEAEGFKFYSADVTRKTSLAQAHVQLDLHTNKEKRYLRAQDIIDEVNLREGDQCLFMLHHNHMIEGELDVLEDLFKLLKKNKLEVFWISELV